MLGRDLEELEWVQTIPSIWIDVAKMTLVALLSAALLYLPVFGVSDSLRTLFGRVEGFWKLVGVGVYGYLCTLPVLAMVIIVVGVLSEYLPSPSHPISEDFASASGSTWIAIFLAAVVLAPLVEEMMFRGLLLPALASRLKPMAAIVLCGLLFAAIHPQGPLLWAALGTTGAVAAYLRYHSGSLIPSIALHTVHNGFIFLSGFLMS
jgi:membrane protease YdiL (CAAX protease family)